MDKKKEIFIERKIRPYMCLLCNETVTVVHAEPKTIETDRSIIHTFDYGHRHDRTLQILERNIYVVENNKK